MSFVTLAQVGEVQPDLPLAVDAGDFDIALVRHDQELFAIRDECSHANVALSEGDVEGCTVECYLHGSRFDLRTGEALGLPATDPVPVWVWAVWPVPLSVMSAGRSSSASAATSMSVA